jgi:small subunit ribosomal protein S16
MATKIRLMRRGRKKYARYDIVVADSRSPRDGKFIEKIGLFNPTGIPNQIELDVEKAFKWVMTGAEPTDSVKTILSNAGVLLKKHLQVGVNKGAITQEQADTKFQEWLSVKEKKAETVLKTASAAKDAQKKEKHAAEAKVNEARKAAQLAKLTPVVEEVAEEAPAEEAPATEGETSAE